LLRVKILKRRRRQPYYKANLKYVSNNGRLYCTVYDCNY
jgi:hypothetical protein